MSSGSDLPTEGTQDIPRSERNGLHSLGPFSEDGVDDVSLLLPDDLARQIEECIQRLSLIHI